MISVKTSSLLDRTVLTKHPGTLAAAAQAQFDFGRRGTHAEVCGVRYARRLSSAGGFGEVLARGDASARRTGPRPLAL